MQCCTANTRHGVRKKEVQEDLSIQEIGLERTYR